MYRNIIYPLQEYFFLEKNENTEEEEKNNKLEILLIEFEEVSNKSRMFYECEYLEEIKKFDKKYEKFYNKDIKNNNINQIDNDILSNNNNNSFPFEEFSSLRSTSDKTKLNKNDPMKVNLLLNKISSIKLAKKNKFINVIDIHSMFYGCKSLRRIHDISKWNTDEVTTLSEIFYECSSLTSIPDISTWNTDNVKEMHSLF